MIALYYSMLFEYTNNIYLYNTYICVYMYIHTPSNIYANTYRVQFSSVNQLCPTLWTPCTAAHQASLSITNSRSLLKLMSITPVMPSNHLILCRPLLLLPSIFPSIRVFSNESALHIRWPKYWSFSFNISPSNEHPGLISFRMDWLYLLAVQGTLKSLLQHDSSSAAIVEPKSVTISIASSSNCHEVMGPDTMIFVFWMLSYSNIKWKLNFEKCTIWDLWVSVLFGDWLRAIAPTASQRVPSNWSKEVGGCQHICDLVEGGCAIKHVSQKSCYSHRPHVSVNDFSTSLSKKRCEKPRS